jgi:hypothetical protein
MGYCRLIVKTGSLTSRIYQELYSTQATGLSGDLRTQKVLNLSQELCAIRDESRKTFVRYSPLPEGPLNYPSCVFGLVG